MRADCCIRINIPIKSWKLNEWMSFVQSISYITSYNALFWYFQDIPPVNVFGPGSYVKRGFLMKLEMSSQPLGQRKWRRRFCILTLDKMFLYEDEKSRGYEKHSEVIQLSNFQRCQRSSFSKNGGYFEFSLLDEERRQNSRKTTKRFFHHVTSSVRILVPKGLAILFKKRIAFLMIWFGFRNPLWWHWHSQSEI